MLGNHAVVRPIEYPHYHLGFEDETIVCLDLNTDVREAAARHVVPLGRQGDGSDGTSVFAIDDFLIGVQ
jgi:hypothetical protein